MTCDQPGSPLVCFTRAPAVRLKPDRRRDPCTCCCRGRRGRRADKRWRADGVPCLILRRERVPC